MPLPKRFGQNYDGSSKTELFPVFHEKSTAATSSSPTIPLPKTVTEPPLPPKLFHIFRRPGDRIPSPSLSSGHDRLSDLPDELLTMIFDHVWLAKPDDERLRSNSLIISKVFLPHTMKNLYRSVDLLTYDEALRFAAIVNPLATLRPIPSEQIEQATYLGSLVEILNIDIDASREPETRHFNPIRFCELFGKLPQLKKLKLVGSMYQLNELFSFASKRHHTKLPHLQSLEIRGLKLRDNHDLPFNVASWASIRHFEKLTELTLTDLHPQVMPRTGFPSWEPYFSGSSGVDGSEGFARLKILRLTGDLSTAGSPGLAHLLRACTNLSELDLDDWSRNMILQTTLANASPILTQLTICRWPSSGGGTNIADTVGISRSGKDLPNLKKIAVAEFVFTDQCYTSLHTFESLEEVSLYAWETDIKASQLMALLHSDTRPPNLKHVFIDSIDGHVGDNIDQITQFPPDDDQWEDMTENHGWYYPMWSSDLDFKSAHDFFLKAQFCGIRVTGGFVNALKVERLLNAYDDPGRTKLLEAAEEKRRMKRYWRAWSDGWLGKTKSREDFWKKWSRGELGRVR